MQSDLKDLNDKIQLTLSILPMKAFYGNVPELVMLNF